MLPSRCTTDITRVNYSKHKENMFVSERPLWYEEVSLWNVILDFLRYFSCCLFRKSILIDPVCFMRIQCVHVFLFFSLFLFFSFLSLLSVHCPRLYHCVIFIYFIVLIYSVIIMTILHPAHPVISRIVETRAINTFISIILHVTTHWHCFIITIIKNNHANIVNTYIINIYVHMWVT